MDPETVLSKLDVRPRSLTPIEGITDLPEHWVSQTPKNAKETDSHADFIKSRIARHKSSSLTSIFESIDQLSKGARGIMHQMALLKSEVQILRETNERLNKRRRIKKHNYGMEEVFL